MYTCRSYLVCLCIKFERRLVARAEHAASNSFGLGSSWFAVQEDASSSEHDKTPKSCEVLEASGAVGVLFKSHLGDVGTSN